MRYHQRPHFVLRMSLVVLGQDQCEEPAGMELIRFGWGKDRIYGEIWAELEAMPPLTSQLSGHDSGGRK